MIDNMTNDVKIPEESQKRIGKFKPRKQFKNFILAKYTGSNVTNRLNSNFAFIEGKYFSEMMEGVKFKITILDEGTIDFEEMDGTNLSNDTIIEGFIDELCSMEIKFYARKSCIGAPFTTDKNKPIYLEVEYKSPHNALQEMLNDDTIKPSISQGSRSFLDDLLGGLDEESINSEEPVNEEMTNDNPPLSEESGSAFKEMVKKNFEKEKAEKLQELQDRLEKAVDDHKKHSFAQKNSQSMSDKAKEQIQILTSRVDSMTPPKDPNGYVFFVSEENKTDIQMDENMSKCIDKLAPILRLKADVVKDMLTRGTHAIKIAKKGQYSEEDSNNLEVPKEILLSIDKMDPENKMSITQKKNEFLYLGDMTWHQLVGKMIKNGFEQDPEFDKISGSNSYGNLSPEGFEHKAPKESLPLEVNQGGIPNMMEYDDNELFEEQKDFKDFVFSIDGNVPKTTSTSNDIPFCVHITPKRFWDKNSFKYDQHIEHLVALENFEEVEEGTFVPIDGSWQLIDIIRDLCSNKILPSLSFQDYIHSMNNTLIDSTILNSHITIMGYKSVK